VHEKENALSTLSSLPADLRFAARNLAKQPGLAAVAVLTLALGIGANTALFSVIDSVLLTPPPFHEPGRLVVAWGSNPELARAVGLPDKIPISNADFYDWQGGTRSFAHLAMLRGDRVNLTGQGEPEQLGTVRVSGDFFTVLGTPAALGRTLQPADDRLGKPTTVVLSHPFWQRKFGGDPRVIGRTVSLSGNPMTVVGVMPPLFLFPRAGEMPAGFGFTDAPDIWLPQGLTAEERQNRGSHNAIAIGRLRPGATVAGADAELKTIAARIAQAHPDTNKGWSARVLTMSEQRGGDIRPALLVLWAAVGCVLLIACANVASLLLARAAARQREIALRTAIGAGRGRLIAQLLTESGLLAFLGGTLGVAFAAAGLRAFAAFLPAGVAGAGSLSLSGRVLAWTALLCLATCILAGLAPAFQLTRPDLSSSLREGSRGSAGAGRSRRTQRGLVVAEVALAVVLLVGAGLLLRSFGQLLSVNPGFKAAHVLSFEVDLPEDRYTKPQRAAFFDRLLDRLKALPGVTAVGAVSGLPMGGEDINSLTLEGRPRPTADKPYLADSRQATLGYFETMGIPLRRGRLFAATDTREAPKVAVVDEVLARTFWPGESPIGKRFKNGGPKDKDPWITVIGVVGSVRNSGLHVEPRPQMYRPEEQASSAGMAVVLRTASGDPESLAAAARAAVHEVDRDQPVSNVKTLDQVVAESVAGRRFNLLLLSLFAALALTLSGVGIYGVTAYSVVQRTREMGLRMALGSQAGQVLRLVVGEAGLLAGTGVLIGLLAAFGLTRVMSSLLYGVGSTDPATFAAVALGLLLIALAAACLPGLRATRVDPMVALRGE
jgi:putative ABC transport system permease protein